MVMVSKFSNFPDELSKTDELRGYELSRSHCTRVDVECHFGQLKRFFCLREQLRVVPLFVTQIVAACCVLWNLSLDLGKYLLSFNKLFQKCFLLKTFKSLSHETFATF